MTEKLGILTEATEITDREMNSILASPYFFRCSHPESDECLECDKLPFGVLYLWYEIEDVPSSLGYLCREHFLQDYLDRWKGNL